jgi:hypothetical protein
VQGPFTPAQLQQLLRAGVVSRDAPVRHPQHGIMPLSEVGGWAGRQTGLTGS